MPRPPGAPPRNFRYCTVRTRCGCERVTFGLDSRERRRLSPARPRALPRAPAAARATAPLPAPIAARDRRARGLARATRCSGSPRSMPQYKAINAMPDGADKEQARKTLNEHGNKLAYEAIRRELLRAVYSPVAAAGADGLVLAQSLQRLSSTRPICAGWSATTRSMRSARMRSATSRTWCSRPSNIRPCCSIWTTSKTPPATSTRTTRASSWNCTRSAWMGLYAAGRAAAGAGAHRRRHQCRRCAEAQARIAAPVPAQRRLRIQSVAPRFRPQDAARASLIDGRGFGEVEDAVT